MTQMKCFVAPFNSSHTHLFEALYNTIAATRAQRRSPYSSVLTTRPSLILIVPVHVLQSTLTVALLYSRSYTPFLPLGLQVPFGVP